MVRLIAINSQKKKKRKKELIVFISVTLEDHLSHVYHVYYIVFCYQNKQFSHITVWPLYAVCFSFTNILTPII